MKRGKQTCRILKEIRKQIAEANDIEFVTSECQYQGDCLGTCPKCESEVSYLEQQLEYKRLAGKAITILGVSAGILTLATPMQANIQQAEDFIKMAHDSLITNESKQVRLSEIVKEDIINNSDRMTIGMVEQMPTFPGGVHELLNFLKKNVHYPDSTISIQGRVIIQFTVKKDGSFINAEVMRGIHPLFDKEALRVINAMPKWEPGRVSGRLVETKMTIPIVFNGDGIKVSKTQIIETRSALTQDSIINIRGRVINSKGEPIIGATINVEKNEKYGAITDKYGHFELKIPAKSPLIVAYVSMQTQRIDISRYNVPYINVVLMEDNTAIMGEAVVTEIDKCQK